MSLADICNLLLVTFAGIALYVGLKQVAISREISALSAYESYHMTCINHPEFSAGFAFDKASELEIERYRMFVLYALMTGERILNLFPKDKLWIFAIEDDVRIHQEFLSSDHFRPYRGKQDPKMSALIERVLSQFEDSA
ncbi:MAG: hypothetical protein ABL878_17665 [Burkholderiales bacterium]